MTSFQRYVLLPQESKNEPTSLDSEFKRVLDSKIPDDAKVKLYSHLLYRHSQRRQQALRRQKAPIIEKKDNRL